MKSLYVTEELKNQIDLLLQQGVLQREELKELVDMQCADAAAYLELRAREVAQQAFGTSVFVRGLIEVSSYCRNNCYYCGIRCANREAKRYRLDKDTILECCKRGYQLGFRTFVMQGGEDPVQSDDFIEEVVSDIRMLYPDCAITLSLGEKSRRAYERFFRAGANRYLLRHETYEETHYNRLHPHPMSRNNRLRCLNDLKEIGYQVGTGIMVGSPGQTTDNIVDDLLFIHRLRPQMIGIGPFVPHRSTPFAHEQAGSVALTLRLISIFRLMHPYALIPSTTALATLSAEGRSRGILAGANVVMPNLSPLAQRKNYELYNEKASLGAESAEGLLLLQQQLSKVGYHIDYQRGDYKELCIK